MSPSLSPGSEVESHLKQLTRRGSIRKRYVMLHRVNEQSIEARSRMPTYAAAWTCTVSGSSCAALFHRASAYQRTDATSRERAPDHQYTLPIEQVAELYAKAGHPRTPRAIQKYCALSKLDCHKVETETGEKYLVAPYSVDHHIAYINEVRTVANGRDQTRTDANVRTMEIKEIETANSHEQSRPDATVRATDDRYTVLLEDENKFLRGQVSVKDTQIEALLERDKETNTLIHRLQAMLAPLLVAPGERHTSTTAGDRIETPASL